MAVIVTIAGTDRTRLVVPESLRVVAILTRQVDTCSFIIKKFGTRTFAPEVGQEVVIAKDGTTIFGGRIVRVDLDYYELDMASYRVECVDYTRELDHRMVIETYENMTVNAIIADIATNYLRPNITLAHVSAPVTVEYIAFNYEYPSKCLQQLADLIGYDWYIDESRDIHFFSKETNAAPFELSDTGGMYIYQTLRIRRDISPVRNTVVVRGGEYLGNTFTVERVGDGTHQVFGTEYKMADLRVTVTGQEKNVGIDPIDDIGSYDALHNFNEKFVRFRNDKIPTNTSNVKIIGRPYLPVIVKVRDSSSVEAFSATEGYGIHEYKIIDKSLKTKEGARQRAYAETIAYAATLSEGEFQTHEDGLKPGQRIRVQSTLRGLDEYFIINKVEAQLFENSTGTMLYTASMVTTKTMDYIDLLQKLLTDKDKDIEINQNEILDEVEAASETIGMDETWTASIRPDSANTETIGMDDSTFTAQALNYDPDFVLGLWTGGPEDGVKRQFILDGSPLE